MSLCPGQTLSHYRIERQIGAGGMGAVFLAEDTKLGHLAVGKKTFEDDLGIGGFQLWEDAKK